MKAVIPVAKKKDSMFPFSESRPTSLMPVMGKPLVKHLVSSLQDAGVDDIYLVTNYMEDEFEEVFGEYTNVNLVSQEELEGTAAAVSTCSFIEEDFLVVNGDVMVSGDDIRSLLDKHRGNGATLLATGTDSPEKFGVLSIEDDRVKAIDEKPEEAENQLVNTGIYVFSPEIFDVIENTGSSELTDAVEEFIDDVDVRFEFLEDYWIDVGSPKKLIQADRIKREYDMESRVHPEADVSETAEVKDSYIGKNAVLEPGAVVEDSYISEGVAVGPGTVIRHSTVNTESIVEATAVESSLLFESTVIDPATHLENVILGKETDVKPGTVIRESFIGPRSFIEMNNSIYGVKFVPDARTDLSEISK